MEPEQDMLAFPAVETEQQSTSEALLRGLKVCLGLVCVWVMRRVGQQA